MSKRFLDSTGIKELTRKIFFWCKKTWTGTKAEWEALSDEEKNKYDIANVVGDYDTDSSDSSDFYEYVEHPEIASTVFALNESDNSKWPWFEMPRDGYFNAGMNPTIAASSIAEIGYIRLMMKRSDNSVACLDGRPAPNKYYQAVNAFVPKGTKICVFVLLPNGDISSNTKHVFIAYKK